MASIFTRSALEGFIQGEGAEEIINSVMSLYGRAIEEGYISKAVAEEDKKAAVANALEEAKKNVPAPDIKGSEEYKALESEFNAYKTMQNARTSEDFKSVKPKFFETVYGLIDRQQGAKPITEQLTAIKTQYEEYFNEENVEPPKPTFSNGTNGTPPSGNTEPSLADMWGYSKKFSQKGQ